MLDLKLKTGRLYVLPIYLYICIIHLPLSSPCYWSKLSIIFLMILWEENPETPQIIVEETIFKFCKQTNFSNTIQTHVLHPLLLLKWDTNIHVTFSKEATVISHIHFSYAVINLNTYWDIHREKNYAINLFDLCQPVGPHRFRFLQLPL